MQTLSSNEPFRSAHGRALAAVILLTASMGLTLVSACASLAKIATGAASRLPNVGDVSVFDFIDLGVGLTHIVVFIATVVAFCLWLYTACKNLPSLGNPKSAIKHTPGWAVGSFFVPFANLVMPFRAVREVWDKSDPAVPFDKYVSPVEPSAPLVMNAWWAFWLISNFVNNAAFRVSLRASTSGEVYVATVLDLIGDLLTIPAAAFAILVVREIDRRQEERSRRVVYSPQGPPPPPLFTTPPPLMGGQG